MHACRTCYARLNVSTGYLCFGEHSWLTLFHWSSVPKAFCGEAASNTCFFKRHHHFASSLSSERRSWELVDAGVRSKTCTVCCRHQGCERSVTVHKTPRGGMHLRWLCTLTGYLLQIKSAEDQRRGENAGEGKLGAHMALALAAGKETSILGFLAGPAEV